MGSLGSVLGKKRLNMNLHYFALFLLLVLAVNGAPKPDPKASPKAAPKPNPKPKAKPNPKVDPKAKAQMAIIFMETRELSRNAVNMGEIMRNAVNMLVMFMAMTMVKVMVMVMLTMAWNGVRVLARNKV